MCASGREQAPSCGRFQSSLSLSLPLTSSGVTSAWVGDTVLLFIFLCLAGRLESSVLVLLLSETIDTVLDGRVNNSQAEYSVKGVAALQKCTQDGVAALLGSGA